MLKRDVGTTAVALLITAIFPFQSALAQTPIPPAQPVPGYPPAATYPQQPTYPQQQPTYPQPQPTYPQQQSPYPPSYPPSYPPQQTYPPDPTQAYPQQTYPPSAGYPSQMYPQQMAYPQQAMPPQAHPIRQLFAGTIAMLLGATGAGAATGLAGIAQRIIGAIAGWFSHKTEPSQSMQAYGGTQPYPPAYGSVASPYGTPAQAYPPAVGYVPPPSYPAPNSAYPPAPQPYPGSGTPSAGAYPPATSYPPSSAYPPNAVPGTGYPTSGAYPPTAATSPYPPSNPYPTTYGATVGAAVAPAQVYNAYTGQPTSAAGTPYQMVGTRGLEPTLYAGIAYEVHTVGADGSTTAVDPASHIFHTGDRFVVLYRPSMPGRMEVYNINPSGQRTRIDTTSMAAGQLAVLGPYQFSSTTGDESLRLVVSPCSSPELLVATRDIVNVSATATAPSSSGAIQLGTCTEPGTRDVKSRDITKVAVEDGTAFALDPVSQQELTAGHVTPREINIAFHHR
jgi:hypothetical protein